MKKIAIVGAGISLDMTMAHALQNMSVKEVVQMATKLHASTPTIPTNPSWFITSGFKGKVVGVSMIDDRVRIAFACGKVLHFWGVSRDRSTILFRGEPNRMSFRSVYMSMLRKIMHNTIKCKELTMIGNYPVYHFEVL